MAAICLGLNVLSSLLEFRYLRYESDTRAIPIPNLGFITHKYIIQLNIQCLQNENAIWTHYTPAVFCFTLLFLRAG